MNRSIISHACAWLFVGALVVSQDALGVARAAEPTALVSLPSSFAAAEASQQERGSRGTTTVTQFMQSLTAYGVWMVHPQFGWVWQPHDVQPWWQPFAVGEWIATQNGSPYWRSGLPFGWATEHYGSWTFDEHKGWLWVPSNEWSAARVSWRARDGIVGWAPLMATTSDTQSVACPQPAWAWIFVATNRLFTTTNFAVAEQELTSRDAHGTWGAWAHQPDGLGAARVPEPRNANLLDATQCLSAADATDLFKRARTERGLATQGPPITWVLRHSEMGSGRVTRGQLPVYAPVITGEVPPLGGNLLVNPPAPRVQRAVRLDAAQPVPRNAPAASTPPAKRLPPVQPVPPALPAPAIVAATPISNYDAFHYQHEALDEHSATEHDALCKTHAADATTPPFPGFDSTALPAWQQREMQEMQRMAARQRKLLDAKQHAVNDAPAAAPTSAPASTAAPTAAPAAPPTAPPAPTPATP